MVSAARAARGLEGSPREGQHGGRQEGRCVMGVMARHLAMVICKNQFPGVPDIPNGRTS